ncbi:MAG TPA: hypothetical protein VMM56_14580 [Planctomycetaceae bacterium]|nr:hypothetical protein [Planctomycetaceae bacterium]
MTNKNAIWLAIFLAGFLFLSWRAVQFEAGAVYVKPSAGTAEYEEVPFLLREEAGSEFSWPRTMGVWLAAALTFAIFSFLFGDNVVYKIAESIFVGASAAYAMVVAFWSAFVGLLVGRLTPDIARMTFMPGSKQETDLWFLIPLALGILMLWRLMPTGKWVARWPLAFFIAVFAGLRLVVHFQSDFIVQIQSTILPLIVFAADGSLDIKTSLWNMTMVFGTLACLTYFFFSLEHTGIVGGISKVGIYLLMITFGVGFALTVMSRYSLLIGRMNFLLKDWLHIGIEM